MMRLIKYRVAAMLLTGIFLVSNVGIPVILASCPMMKAGKRAACCPIGNDDHTLIIKKYQDYSCCRTVVAAERNTTEFVQNPAHRFTDRNESLLIFANLPTKLCDIIYQRIIFCDTHSPPLSEDIPLLTSTFRI
jgi:hypothetical protein